MIEKNDFIKTPLNYTGNKSRILSQMLPLFPNNINRFVDLFCGGATVGLNVLSRSKEVVCLDINESVIHLLQTLQLFSESNLILKIEEIIEKFNLSDTYNKGYDIYRKDLHEQIQLFYRAFVHKNRIFPKDVEKSNRNISESERLKLSMMMNSITASEIRKELTDGKNK